MTTHALVDRRSVVAALDRVVDPCSGAMGVPVGLHDMGLVTAVEIKAGEVDVTMRLTSPCCSYGPLLAARAEAEVGAVEGVERVTVRIDHGSMWTPGAMSTRAAARLDERRRRTVALSGVRPHDWGAP